MTGDTIDGIDLAPTRPSVGRQDTFVVRIWSADTFGLMRGHIRHVGSRRRAYFASRQQLQGFIEERLRTTEEQTWRS
jgi:hypothetical protein